MLSLHFDGVCCLNINMESVCSHTLLSLLLSEAGCEGVLHKPQHRKQYASALFNYPPDKWSN